MRHLIFSVALVLFAVSARATIPNERQVSSGITRGGRPELTDLSGFKTIINLENRFKFVDAEKERADQLGIKFISSPMDPSDIPDQKEILRLIAIMKNKNNQPIFIHCFHGQDRTGLVVGVYRMLVEGWAPERAYQEMLDDGFHPRYEEMKNFFFTQAQNP